MPYEYDPTAEPDIQHNFPKEVPEESLAVPSATQLDIIRRQDLAKRTTVLLGEVLEQPVSLPDLIERTKSQAATPARLIARRAIRAITDIAKPESEVVAKVGTDSLSLYNYAEGVIEFGASRRVYLALMENFGLTSAQTTALYALREQIAEETNGDNISFPKLQASLRKVGWTMLQASEDTDGAMQAFADAGFFVNIRGGTTYDRPIFRPELADSLQSKKPGPHIDSVRYAGESDAAWVKNYMTETGYGQYSEEME